MAPETLERIVAGEISKGGVFEVARIAGVMAAKKTSELIPLCHAIALEDVQVEFAPLTGEAAVAIRARVCCHGKTGVELEALTAVNVAALTIYDMAKAVDRGMWVGEVHLHRKTGGRSGTFVNPAPPGPRLPDELRWT